MDHNIPDVIWVICLDPVWRRLISRGIRSERALLYSPLPRTMVTRLFALTHMKISKPADVAARADDQRSFKGFISLPPPSLSPLPP